jgi:hypothetical protein
MPPRFLLVEERAVSASDLGDRLTAHHEAGHAVAAILFGWDVVVVDIDTDEAKGRKGHCAYDFSGRPLPLDAVGRAAWALDFGAVTRAGYLAERRFAKALASAQGGDVSSWRDYLDSGAAIDDDHLRLAYFELAGGDGDQFGSWLADVFRVAAARMNPHGDAVGTVADALVNKRSLTGAEVRALARL